MNKEWHARHPMPPKAIFEQRPDSARSYCWITFSDVALIFRPVKGRNGTKLNV